VHSKKYSAHFADVGKTIRIWHWQDSTTMPMAIPKSCFLKYPMGITWDIGIFLIQFWFRPIRIF